MQDPESPVPSTTTTTLKDDTSCKSTNSIRDGLAAITASLSFIVGFALFSTVLQDLADDLTAVEQLQVIKDNEKVYYLSNFILYILFGLAQLVLTVGLATASKKDYPGWSRIAELLGTIWSTLVLAAGMIGNIGAEKALDMVSNGEDTEASILWQTVRTIHSGVGGGNEIVGGLWVLLAGWLYFLPDRCNNTWFDFVVLGLANVAGWAGIISTVPVAAENVIVIFGVTMILWYLVMGVALIVRRRA